MSVVGREPILAYSVYDSVEDESSIWTLPLAGGTPTKVLSRVGYAGWAGPGYEGTEVSPDFSRIAFKELVDNGTRWVWDLKVMNADGSGETLVHAEVDSGSLVPDSAYSVTTPTPAWHPDGSKILYWETGGDLWTADSDGSNAASLGVTGARAQYNRDGSIIAFSRRISGTEHIRRCDPDGSNEAGIVTAGTVTGLRRFAWANLTDTLFYGEHASSGSYYRVEADGTGKTEMHSAGFYSGLQPITARYAWAPDDSLTVGTQFDATAWRLWEFAGDASGEITLSPTRRCGGTAFQWPSFYGDRIYFVATLSDGGTAYDELASILPDGSDYRVEVDSSATFEIHLSDRN
jgi:hypothetical protein